MAKFGWAYINCADSGSTDGGSFGATGSVQFLTGSGNTTGSNNFMYHTAAIYGYSANTLVLTGTLLVTGTISASHYHISNVAIIDATGSTYFGNTDDDQHFRTGSFVITPAGQAPANYALSASVVDKRVHVRALSGRYRKITGNGNIAADDYIIGASGSGNQTLYLPSASAVGAGALLVIKDEYLHRASTRIYVSASNPAGGFTIDGDSYYTLTGSMPAVNLYSNGTNWFVY
tara:strand:- start:203 stop:898 length:696 start_codon:yes stop_codon:yes gene_type:complete